MNRVAYNSRLQGMHNPDVAECPVQFADMLRWWISASARMQSICRPCILCPGMQVDVCLDKGTEVRFRWQYGAGDFDRHAVQITNLYLVQIRRYMFHQ